MVLSIAATIPVVQFASLGYMLECSARVARGDRLKDCFPGVALAGNMFRCALAMLLTWLPIWLITDWAYSSELIQPSSNAALSLRIVARILSLLWVLWVVWAIASGGRWRNFLVPRPIRFLRAILSKAFWLDIEDQWWSFLNRLELWHLIKLGFQASLGAWIWLAIPALLILISLGAAPEVKSDQQGGLALLGLLGALLMTRAIQYLPTLQTTMALQKSIADKTDRRWLYGILDRTVARGVFRKVPITYSIANILFLALALPLYFLRIESIPSELWFLLSILFVLWMFPAKLVIGWMIRRSRNKTNDAWWPLRWIAWIAQVAAIGIYVGFLYLGKFALWEGGASLFFQHAFLPPVPFFVR
ncbi:MAG: hypothetical protein RJB11_309 [Planctomycetota bacterium]